MSRKGKIIFIIAVIFILAAIVVGVFLGLRKIKTVSRITQGETFPIASSSIGGDLSSSDNTALSREGINGEIGETELSDLNHLTQLTKGPVVDYWITSAITGNNVEESATSSLLRSAVFYITPQGDIVQIRNVGVEEIVSHLGGNPLRLTQTRDGSYVLIYFTTHDVALFNSIKNSFEWLPQGVVSAVFSPDGKKLAYLQIESSGKQSLYIRDLTSLKKTVTKAFSLFIDDVSLAWPLENNIYIISPQSANLVGEIWYFDMTQKTLNKFTSGTGIGMLFSQLAPRALLFRNTGSSIISISLINTKTGTSTPLNFSTFESKCVFSFNSEDVLCAVPQVKSKDFVSRLPDDYNSMSVFTNDYLYRLPADVAYSPQLLLGTTYVPFDAKNLRSRSQQVFFINRLDDSLYVFDYKK